MASLLSESSEKDIDEFSRNLLKARNRASTDLQQNVYQNRTQFIKISKEAEKLKGEIRALRNLMAELKMNATALSVASSSGDMQGSTYEGFSSASRRREIGRAHV